MRGAPWDRYTSDVDDDTGDTGGTDRRLQGADAARLRAELRRPPRSPHPADPHGDDAIGRSAGDGRGAHDE
jgi:hypothetical protein